MIAHSTQVAAAPDAVWTALQDAATWEGIAGIRGVHDMTHTDGLLESFDFHIEVAGMRFDGTASVVKRTPGEAMTLDLDSKDLGARLAVRVKPDEAASKLVVGAELTPKSMIVKMAFPAVEKAVQGGLPREVEAFAGRLGA